MEFRFVKNKNGFIWFVDVGPIKHPCGCCGNLMIIEWALKHCRAQRAKADCVFSKTDTFSLWLHLAVCWKSTLFVFSLAFVLPIWILQSMGPTILWLPARLSYYKPSDLFSFREVTVMKRWAILSKNTRDIWMIWQWILDRQICIFWPKRVIRSSRNSRSPLVNLGF